MQLSVGEGGDVEGLLSVGYLSNVDAGASNVWVIVSSECESSLSSRFRFIHSPSEIARESVSLNKFTGAFPLTLK